MNSKMTRLYLQRMENIPENSERTLLHGAANNCYFRSRQRKLEVENELNKLKDGKSSDEMLPKVIRKISKHVFPHWYHSY